MSDVKAHAAASAVSPLAASLIERRAPREKDVRIEILFCGVCHSDLHQVRNAWSEVAPTIYPCIPGHEIVGRISQVGSAVTKFKVGDLAAVNITTYSPMKHLGVGKRKKVGIVGLGGLGHMAVKLETQEMLDFCGENGLTADIEVIPIQKINEAYGRLLKSDVKYLIPIHMAAPKAEA